jgi:hypothetical protein
VNELVGEDLPGCESSYETSIIMLEAVLEPIPSLDSAESESSADRLDEEDRLTIEKCTSVVVALLILVIQSIRKRLEALRKKLDFASQRNSPTPSMEKLERDRMRRLSTGSNSSNSAVRQTDSPTSPSTPIQTPTLPRSTPTPIPSTPTTTNTTNTF